MTRGLRALSVLALALWSPEARVSQVRHETVTLDEVVAQAGCVLRGHLSTPPSASVAFEVPLVIDGAVVEKPHALGVVNVVIDEVLAGTCHAPGTEIRVISPDADDTFGLWVEYETIGLSKSPIYFTMEGGFNVWDPGASGQEAIFLLRAATPVSTPAGDQQAAWAAYKAVAEGCQRFVVTGSVVGLGRLAQVKLLLEKR